MPDLGNRANVNGPQPIGKVVEPPADLYDTGRRFLERLMKGDKPGALAMAADDARDDVAAAADSLGPNSYSEMEFFGRARVVKHWWLKARLTKGGGAPAIVQFRLGTGANGEWMVYEMMNLTGVRSGWSL
ncbi:MAG TPA: hypothetical protein VEJ86_05625 [Candidatus Binataceae bacterium]|nr:hypothetical protein [Candidatus Binataceae bacterium]